VALADTARLLVELRLDDKFSGPLGRATGSLNRVQSGLFQTGKGIGQVAAGLGRVGVIAAGAAAGGIATVAHLAGNFEAQLNTINTIAQTNEEALTHIGEGIRNTFRETGQPLEDLTAGYYDLLSAGVKVTDAQKELDLAVRLGIGGLGSTKEAVDLLTTAQNSYKLSIDDVAQASDVFAKAVEDGKVTISEIAGSFANVAPTAHQFGVSIQEIGAAYGFLTARGVPAAEATTQMNRAILDLVKPSSDATKVLKELGTTGAELIKKEGLVGALQTMRDEAKKLGIPFQDLFGRIEGYKFALQTTGKANADFNRELSRMGDAVGTANSQFEERQKGLNFQLSKLKALAQDAGITIGNALLPKLVPLVSRLNDFIQKNQGKIQEFASELADGIGKFADSITEADIGNFVNNLKTLASVGAQVAKIFLSLPSGIQAIIVGGAAINKLSGGLVGAGVGNIIGGGIKILFERGSSPANPLWVQQVGGPGGGGPGGGGGFWTNAGRLLGLAAAAVIAERIVSETQTGLSNARDVSQGNLPRSPVNSVNVGPLVQLNRELFRQMGLLGIALSAHGDLATAINKVPEATRGPLIHAIVTNPLQQKALHLSADQIAYLRRLDGSVDETTRAVNRVATDTRTLQQRINDQRLATERGFRTANAALGVVARKDFSPSFNASIYTQVTARLSTYNALTTINRVDNIRYNGKPVPISA